MVERVADAKLLLECITSYLVLSTTSAISLVQTTIKFDLVAI